MTHYKKHIFICLNQKAAEKKCCANAGGEPFFDYLRMRLLELELQGPGQFRVSKSGCLGRCSIGPCIVIYPEGIWYTYASFDDLDEIIKTHLLQEKIVERLQLTVFTESP